jgi:hypothetical protein
MPCSALTAVNIARQPSPKRPYRIVKRKRPKKPILSPIDLVYRRRYCRWLLNTILGSPGYTPTRRAIFVMSDETPIAFGGPDRHVEWISAPQGTPAHQLPPKQQKSKPNFTIQVLAACSTDLTIERPIRCFIKEDQMEKEDIAGELARCKA